MKPSLQPPQQTQIHQQQHYNKSFVPLHNKLIKYYNVNHEKEENDCLPPSYTTVAI